MSLRTQSREIVFKDFLNKNLSPSERNKVGEFNFEQILNSQEIIFYLNKLIKCIHQIQNDFNLNTNGSGDEEIKEFNLHQIFDIINDYFPIDKCYLFTVDHQSKQVHLSLNYPDSTTTSKTEKSTTKKTGKKVKIDSKSTVELPTRKKSLKAIRINQSFLDLAMKDDYEFKMKSGITRFFEFDSQDFNFKKFTHKNQLNGFIFYSSANQLLPTASLEEFWEIILRPFFQAR